MQIAMQCFTQLGSFTNPRGPKDNVFIGTLAQCKAEFRAWYELHCQLYDGETARKGICANCYYGEAVKDYPDFQLIMDKRGEIIVSST